MSLDNFSILVAVTDSMSFAVRHRITQPIVWFKAQRTIPPLLGVRAGVRADVIADFVTALEESCFASCYLSRLTSAATGKHLRGRAVRASGLIRRKTRQSFHSQPAHDDTEPKPGLDSRRTRRRRHERPSVCQWRGRFHRNSWSGHGGFCATRARRFSEVPFCRTNRAAAAFSPRARREPPSTRQRLRDASGGLGQGCVRLRCASARQALRGLENSVPPVLFPNSAR